MADVIKSSNQLKLLAAFVDEDDRTISIDDPKPNLSWNDISIVENNAANVLIGDKYQAAFSRFKEAKYVETYITEVDTNNNV